MRILRLFLPEPYPWEYQPSRRDTALAVIVMAIVILSGFFT